jgi:hypothetical protein
MLLFTNCKKDSKVQENQTKKNENKAILNLSSEIEKINSKLKKIEVKSQIFIISSKKQTKVKSKLGTTIYVNPNELETIDGTNIGENIEIEFKELINQKELLKSNAQTISNGKILVSGGAYFINMKSNGKQLKLKNNKYLKVDFPKLTENEMFLFYGKKDSLGIMNWKETKTKFTTSKLDNEIVKDTLSKYPVEEEVGETKPLTKEERKINRAVIKNSKLSNRIYNSVQLNNFGWINCDKFYPLGNKTTIEYEFTENKNLICSNVYLVFNDINSVAHNVYYFEDKNYKQEFDNVPIGLHVELIAVSVINNKIFVYKSEFITGKSSKEIINFKETNEKEFAKLFE